MKPFQRERVIDKIMEALRDRSAAHRLLFITTMSYPKTEAIERDLTNDSLTTLITEELYTSLQASFGAYTAKEIMRAVFTQVDKEEVKDI